jgi:ABC-type nitrate/sulfonate/bicarbonate transport system substrate-binding protein
LSVLRNSPGSASRPGPSRSAHRRLLALVPIAAAAIVVAASGASASSASTARSATAPATVRIALDYTPNVDYLGIYDAITKGYFAAEGIKPVVLPYANVAAEQLIQAGKADLAISYPPDIIINRSQGLAYKAVAALVTDNTTALAVLASSDYTNVAQLNGKLYGGFGISSDPPIISAILRAAGVKKVVFRQVVENASVITALAAHKIDYTAVFGGIDDVTAGLQGIKLRTFPYNRYLGAAGNYPNAVYVASDKEISSNAAVLRRALKALAEGYEYATQHPAAAEQILIEDNRAALSSQKNIIVATGNATAPHFEDAAGVWGPQTNADYAGLEQILAKAGVIKQSPALSDLYTNALLP